MMTSMESVALLAGPIEGLHAVPIVAVDFRQDVAHQHLERALLVLRARPIPVEQEQGAEIGGLIFRDRLPFYPAGARIGRRSLTLTPP